MNVAKAEMTFSYLATHNYYPLTTQGVPRSGGTHAGLEHSRRTPGPGAHALEGVPGGQQVLALRPGVDLHLPDADVTHWELHRHLDL